MVDFHRAAFARSPRQARLFWMGDQTVNWSERDGMRSALTGMLSGGMSGFSLNHSDTGGYTTLVDPPVSARAELLGPLGGDERVRRAHVPLATRATARS